MMDDIEGRGGRSRPARETPLLGACGVVRPTDVLDFVIVISGIPLLSQM